MAYVRLRSLALWLSISILLIAVYAACARNPVTGKRQLALISEQQEIAMGKESHPQILAQYGEVDNKQLQAYIDGVGQQLAKISHRPNLEWHFTVVDTPVVNAFAIPGGYIYVTRDIMAYMNNEAELAGVLGHEIGHVTARHSVEQMSKAQLYSLGLGVGSVISPTFQQLSGLAETGLSLLFLKYGRDDERQADQLGVQYMTTANYDPRVMPDFFQIFQRMGQESGQALPDWLSTHPNPSDRIKRTSEESQQALAGRSTSDLKIGQPEYLQRIGGLMFGENPREGFVEDGWFLHPDLKFKVQFPSGWKIQNTRSAVVAAEPNGAAGIQLTLAPQQKSPDDYAQIVATQQGVRMLDGRHATINGNPSFLGVYQVTDQASGQSIGALAAFISYKGTLYQLVGITSANQFSSARGIFERSLGTFDELTDSRALAVQPDRLRVERARQGDTLQTMARRLNNPRVKIEDLVLLNRLDAEAPLRSGAEVKLIEPGRR